LHHHLHHHHTSYHHSSWGPRRVASQVCFLNLLYITILLNKICLQSPPRTSQQRPTMANADPQHPMQATTV
jgi:hypothetical protein